MAFLRVSQCCCGCSLEMGTKIIAILGLIGGVLGALGGMYEAATVPSELVLAAVFKVLGNVASVIISGFLLQGCSSRKPVYLLPWLVVQGIGLVIACIGLPIYVCFMVYVVAAGTGGDGQAIGILIGVLILVALCVCKYILTK